MPFYPCRGGGNSITSSKSVYDSGSSDLNSVSSFKFSNAAVGKIYAVDISGIRTTSGKITFNVSGAEVIWEDYIEFYPDTRASHFYAALIKPTTTTVTFKLSAGILYAGLKVSEII